MNKKYQFAINNTIYGIKEHLKEHEIEIIENTKALDNFEIDNIYECLTQMIKDKDFSELGLCYLHDYIEFWEELFGSYDEEKDRRNLTDIIDSIMTIACYEILKEEVKKNV